MDNDSGKIMGIISIVFGSVTFIVQILGGLICGWLGWPLGIAALILGILAIRKGYKLGWLGIVLSIAGVVLQLLITIGIIGLGTSGALEDLLIQ